IRLARTALAGLSGQLDAGAAVPAAPAPEPPGNPVRLLQQEVVRLAGEGRTPSPVWLSLGAAAACEREVRALRTNMAGIHSKGGGAGDHAVAEVRRAVADVIRLLESGASESA